MHIWRPSLAGYPVAKSCVPAGGEQEKHRVIAFKLGLCFAPLKSVRHRFTVGRIRCLGTVTPKALLRPQSDGPLPAANRPSIRQIKAARALMAWSQEQLAQEADVSLPTIKRLEANDGPLGGRSETGARIQSALQRAGVEFIDENGGGPGVRLRRSVSRKPEK